MSTPDRHDAGPRPSRAAALGGLIVAVDIGGTKTAAAAVTADHRVVVRAQAGTPARQGPRAVLDTALRLARDVQEEAGQHGAGTALAVGIGSAGVIDPTGRAVVSATSALPGWAGTAVAARFESVLGLPATVLGDVQAFLRGEAAAGAARGTGVAVAVMAGTGIGGAVAVEGRVLRGAKGAAGHLGHIPVPSAAGLPCPCGRTGHVESVAAGPALAAAARRRLPGHDVADLPAVARLAREGRAEAVAVLSEGGAALGTALAGVAAALDPDVIVLGGGVLATGPWYADAVRAALAAHALPLLGDLPVRYPSLGADAVLVGAAAQARDQLAAAAPCDPFRPAHANGARA